MASVVHILQVDLGQPSVVVDRLDRSLPRAERAAPPRVRVARAAARDVLGGMLGVEPAEVPISRRCARCGHPTHGRPTVTGGTASFSLSHSGDRALFAITADDVAVGVDIEVVRDRVHLARLAARVLDADELAAWRARPEPDRLVAFLRAWTAKEAYLKARGEGIASSFAAVPEQPVGWTVREIDAPTGFVAALAVEHGDVVLDESTWTPPIGASR